MALTVPTSNTARGQWTPLWQSLYSFEKKPQVWREIFKTYGHLFDIFDWIDLIEKKPIDLKGDTLTLFYINAMEKPITIGTGGIATGAVGADITFTLDAGDYDASGNAALNTASSILIPGAYTTDPSRDYLYRVMSDDGGVGAAKIYTAKPHNKAGTDSTAARITVAVPAGTQLMISGDSFGYGTDQPKGLTRGSVTRSFGTMLSKSTFDMSGGVQFQESYLDNLPLKGGRGVGRLNMASTQMEFDHNRKINYNIMFGQKADNTTFVMNDAFGNSVPIKAQDGLLAWMQKLAIKKTYADKFEVSDFDDIKPLLISVGVGNQEMLFGMGDLLYSNLENAGYNFLKENSATNVMTSLNEVGLEFQIFKKQGFRYILKEFAGLSNPMSTGLAAYSDRYRAMGFMVPIGENPVTITRGTSNADDKVSISSLMMGYPNYNGESRERVVGYLNGMTGNSSIAPITRSTDTLEGMILSEYMPIFTGIEKMVLVNKQ
jgi:hypothetical protein